MYMYFIMYKMVTATMYKIEGRLFGVFTVCELRQSWHKLI